MHKKKCVDWLIVFGCLVVLATLASCGSSRVNYSPVYFCSGADTVALQQKEILIQPNDVLTIQVYSKTTNQEQAVVFNLPANAAQGYQVNGAGNVDMPIIGSVKAGGLTREALQESLAQKLTNYVKNPSVIVRFQQFHINVLGEVRQPGIQKFSVDRVTIIDALSAAGDLTDYGKREDVTVIREEGGKKIYHTVDLRNKEIFRSPVYALQPNDVVYVAPTQSKLKSLGADPDAQRKTGLLFSVISVVVGVAALVVTSLR